MSGLTDWERNRLADLERQLAHEDPELATRLGQPSSTHRSWGRRIGWLMIVVGLVLLLGGSTLRDAVTTLSGFLLLSFCWAPFTLARRADPQSGS